MMKQGKSNVFKEHDTKANWNSGVQCFRTPHNNGLGFLILPPTT